MPPCRWWQSYSSVTEQCQRRPASESIGDHHIPHNHQRIFTIVLADAGTAWLLFALHVLRSSTGATGRRRTGIIVTTPRRLTLWQSYDCLRSRRAAMSVVAFSGYRTIPTEA
jgi:hypothetical protein